MFHMKITAKTIPPYNLAMIFVCQNIPPSIVWLKFSYAKTLPPVYFGYNYHTSNHTEVESFFMYILAVTAV